jgi:hypothetical protein
MQGIDDLDFTYALPLAGIPELGTGYAAIDLDSEELTWTVETSDPGIGAGFRDETLYVWGEDAGWSGYGNVVLAVSDEKSETDSIIMPVTVFAGDRTALASSGETEYFVPWDVQLDINRITSVEEHIAKYNKPDVGLLDRSVRFSAWRKMEHVNGAYIDGWINQFSTGIHSQDALWARVDETYNELARIGCNAIYLLRGYHTSTQTTACPSEVFDAWSPGLGMTEEEAAYAINEAHLQGFYVLFAPNIGDPPEGRQWYPEDLTGWFSCYSNIVRANAILSQRLGIDAFSFANILMPDAFAWPSFSDRYQAYSRMMEPILADDVHPNYSGPVAFMPGSHEVNHASLRILSLLQKVDIVGANSNFTGLTTLSDPSVAELRAAMIAKCEKYIVPIHEQLRKPMFVNEGFTYSFDGAIRNHDFSSAPPVDARYDGQEQADWYRAWFQAQNKYPFLFGFGWAHWTFYADFGGAGNIGHTPRLKPAEAVIAEAYGAPNPFDPIYVDGDPSEWTDLGSTVVDPSGDIPYPGDMDLLTVAAIADEAYLYISVQLAGAANRTSALHLLFDLNGDARPDIPLDVFPVASQSVDPTRLWMSTLHGISMNWPLTVGSIDVESSEDQTFFELRIPLVLLDPSDPLFLQVAALDLQRSRYVDQTEWLEIPIGLGM